MPVQFEILDGPQRAEWASPDIQPGTTSMGTFTAFPAMMMPLPSGQPFDFRVVVRNNGTEDAVPWNDNIATGEFLSPAAGSGNLVGPFTSQQGLTIATEPHNGNTRVQLVSANGFYNLELQDRSGNVLASIANTIDPSNTDRRIFVVFSPTGRYLVALDYNSVSTDVAVSVYLAQSVGALPIGTELFGPNRGFFNVSVPNLRFPNTNSYTQGSYSQYAGLSFAFDPIENSLLLYRASSTGDTVYEILDLRETPQRANRVSISNLHHPAGDLPRLSQGGELFALIPSQPNLAIELFELPSGSPFPITFNGFHSGPLLTTSSAGNLRVEHPTEYGGITLLNITNVSGGSAIDPPSRARCAVQVHLWVGDPGAILDDLHAVKLPARNMGPSAFIARIPRAISGQPGQADVVVLSQYAPTVMTGQTLHRCAIAEAFSVDNARPFEGKQRTTHDFPLTLRQVAQHNLTIVSPNSPYFIAPYVVANNGEKPLEIKLTTRQVDPNKFPPIHAFLKSVPFENLSVQGRGFIEFPCGKLIGRDKVKPLPTLKLTLQPGERRAYALLVDVASEPDPSRLQLAAFHIIEQHGNTRVGGVTVLTASNPALIPPVMIHEAPDACPVDLVKVYWLPAPDAQAPGMRNVFPGNRSGYLAAEFVNRSEAAIDNLEIWIESHALPETRIEPLVFQAHRLDPGKHLFAAWPIETGSFPTARFPLSIVGQSPKHAPHRIFTTVPVSD